MNAGWEVGDLALCVELPRSDPGVDMPWKVEVGGVYTVLEVAFDCRGTVLNFVEDTSFDPECGFDAPCFRKIRPDQHEDCEPEFVTLLNRIKRPAKQGEPA